VVEEVREPVAVDRLERAVQRVRSSEVVRRLARLGLVARALFYLLLAYLAAAVAGGWATDDRQANANGALTTVADTPWGRVALSAAAIGFLGFAFARFSGALGDHSIGRLRRLTTAAQACFYLAMGAATAWFVLGHTATGSSQQARSSTARVLQEPLGQVVLAVAGGTVLVVCGWQIRLAVRGGFADSLRLTDMGRRTQQAAQVVGRVGIIARALAVAPVGALLLVAALTDQAHRAKDLDQVLVALDESPAGSAVVWLVAVGFLVFALYSLLEVPYRRADAGD
jgi:hypothetical protein